MSGENRDYYHHQNPYFSMFNDDLSAFFSQIAAGAAGGTDMIPSAGLQRPNEPQVLPPFTSFIDHLHAPAVDYGAALFDLRKDVFDAGGTVAYRQKLVVDTATVTGANGVNCNSLTPTASATPVTPNSSVSFSSSEVGGEEDAKGSKKDQLKQEEGEEVENKQLPKESEEWSNGKPKKLVNKERKKGEKRQREPRVAFMTKSEVDHLEDGYRWRKYGQKAVKNSPHPRSYYRCTYQKCSVKKRVERSFQDPAIVITTYEGQHTHQIPATVRGNTHLLAPPTAAATAEAFRQDLLMHQMNSSFNNMSNSNINNSNNNLLQGNANPNMYLPILPPSLQQFQDYGLLQDIVPSYIKGSSQP